jgi:hypothetical protein
MLGNTIAILQSNDFHGAGEFTEIAKGKHELVSDWKGLRTKLFRQWRNLKKK